MEGTPSVQDSGKLFLGQPPIDQRLLEMISQKFIPKEKYVNLQTEVNDLRQSFFEMTKKVDAIIRILEFTINQTLQSPGRQNILQKSNSGQNLNQLKKMLSQQLTMPAAASTSQLQAQMMVSGQES